CATPPPPSSTSSSASPRVPVATLQSSHSSPFLHHRHEPSPSFTTMKPSRTPPPPRSVVRSVESSHTPPSSPHKAAASHRGCLVCAAAPSPCVVRKAQPPSPVFSTATFVHAYNLPLPSNFRTHCLFLDTCFSSSIEFHSL
uniref:Uncharacterized protein n=1 Tax=Cucumis melo TaxID=3656 RepID=A0A9I9DXF2_CUCME